MAACMGAAGFVKQGLGVRALVPAWEWGLVRRGAEFLFLSQASAEEYRQEDFGQENYKKSYDRKGAKTSKGGESEGAASCSRFQP